MGSCEGALQIRARETGIARLNVAEQAFLRGEQQAGAVDVNAAAFENDSSFSGQRLPGRHS